MANTVVGYQCNVHGVFIGETLVQEDPKKKGVFLIPAGVYLDAPPSTAANYQAVRVGNKWEVRQTPPPAPPTVDGVRDVQATLFHQEAALSKDRASYLVATSVRFKTEAGKDARFPVTEQTYTKLLQRYHQAVIDGGVPEGFYWVSVSHEKIPFTIQDLKALTSKVWAVIEGADLTYHDLHADLRKVGWAKPWAPFTEYKADSYIVVASDIWTTKKAGKSGEPTVDWSTKSPVTDGDLEWIKVGNQIDMLMALSWPLDLAHSGV